VGKNTTQTSYYKQFYDKVGYKGFSGWLLSFTHKKLEVLPRNYKKLQEIRYNILEVGGGSGEHIPFVKMAYDEYTLVDINPTILPKNHLDKKIKFKLADVEKLPFRNRVFDRVICTCLLHHLNNIENALLEIKRVTKIGGLISIYISCDPGIINRTLRKLFIIPKARKLGFQDYELFIAREHKGHFSAINTLIHHIFYGQKIKVRYYPIGIRSWNLNTFIILQIQIVS
jgi:phosphatidylethanolamine/phosphatidyl-N-methylethanolamine N-methyltransferase